MNLFSSQKPHYEYLQKRWKKRHRDTTQNLFDKHLRKFAIGSLGSLVLMTTPGLSPNTYHLNNQAEIRLDGKTSKNAMLASDLKKVMPTEVRNLSSDEESVVAQKIYDNLGIKVAAEIDNKRLNKTYGLMGGEQHLYRYPGDTVHAHARDAQDWAMYGSSGIAPGLGAWGYFAPSKAAFDADPEIESRERYYIAVQTFLSPGFSERVAEYRDFYKYRKMLVVNPKTGQAVVANIADAGPAEWTGKSLGGSPEVMEALGIAGGPRKGAVIYYFIDDSQQDIPLGPIKMEMDSIASN